jgi:hypothetical protein
MGFASSYKGSKLMLAAELCAICRAACNEEIPTTKETIEQ